MTPPSFGIPGPSFPKVRHITGLDEVLGWLATFDTELPGFRIEPDELIDLGDLVLALVRVSGEGRARSAQVEIPAAHLFTLRDGSAVQVRSFLDHAEARQAAGIAE